MGGASFHAGSDIEDLEVGVVFVLPDELFGLIDTDGLCCHVLGYIIDQENNNYTLIHAIDDLYG